MPNRKVLLTGASGYIASQILPSFQDQYDMALIDVNDSDREGRKVSGVAVIGIATGTGLPTSLARKDGPDRGRQDLWLLPF